MLAARRGRGAGAAGDRVGALAQAPLPPGARDQPGQPPPAALKTSLIDPQTFFFLGTLFHVVVDSLRTLPTPMALDCVVEFLFTIKIQDLFMRAHTDMGTPGGRAGHIGMSASILIMSTSNLSSSTLAAFSSIGEGGCRRRNTRRGGR